MNSHKDGLEDRCKWRGKNFLNKEWLYGSLTNIGRDVCALSSNKLHDYIFVLRNTIGQYSGEKDKNEKEYLLDILI